MLFLNYVIQVIAGLLVTYFLWNASIWTEQADKRVVAASIYADPMSFQLNNVNSPVFQGYADGMSLRNKKFDTINDSKSNYRDFGGGGKGGTSGGSTFSYSFWALVRDPMAIYEYPMKSTLFVKGNPTRYKTFSEQPDPQNKSRSRVIVTDEVLVKSPMVSVYRKDDMLNIVVDVNTTKDLHTSVIINGNSSDDATMRYNIMSLVIGRWTLWTLTFEDTPKGCAVSFFINDMPIHSQLLPSQAVLPNQGDLVLFPDIPQTLNAYLSSPSPAGGDADWRHSMFLADMNFANYAYSRPDINERLAAGVTPTFAAVMDSAVLPDSVLKLSVVNRVDMGNIGSGS